MIYQIQIKQKEFEAAVLKLDISYGDLADKLGVHRAYLSNIKNEKLPEFRPSRELRKRILKTLKVRFDDIFMTIDTKQTKAKKKTVKRRPPVKLKAVKKNPKKRKR